LGKYEARDAAAEEGEEEPDLDDADIPDDVKKDIMENDASGQWDNRSDIWAAAGGHTSGRVSNDSWEGG